MSNIDFTVNAEARDDMGKGASRRLRRENKVPGILYGAGKEPVTLSLDHNEMVHHLEHEAFYSHVLTIKMGKQMEKAVIKDLQRHPAKPIIMHVDFLRVSEREKIRMHVPLHFVGADVAPGVKVGGGMVTHNMNEVEVSCLPKDLPEFIEVELSLLELGHSVHLSELKVPAGVELVELAHGPEHDLPVAAIHATRGSAAEEEGAEESTEEGGD